METLEIIIRVVSGILLILINALFVLTEFGLTRLRQFDREEITEDSRLERGWKMTEELEIYLTSCQLGISATSIVLGVVFEPAITVLLNPVVGAFGFSETTVHTISIVVGLTVINLIHQVWGEQAPTYFGVEKPLKAVKMGSGFLYWWTKLLYPLIKLGDGLSKWTLRAFGVDMTRSWVEEEQDEERKTDTDGTISGVRSAMIDLLKKKSDLSDERADEVIKSYDIGNQPAKEIMISRDELVILKASESFEKVIEKIRGCGHSRYPLYSAESDDYLGNIYLPSLLINYNELESGALSLEELATGCMIRPEEISISELIDAFQQEDQEMCMLKRDKELIGMVTFTDACEAVFGELEDPLDT